MNLIIRKNNNIYELEGALNKLNVHLFQNEFQNVFDKKDELTISIVNLENIDSTGVNAIAKLNKEAILKQKQFSIIGSGNQELFNHLKEIKKSENRNNNVLNFTETIITRLYYLIQNYKTKFMLPRVNAIHK